MNAQELRIGNIVKYSYDSEPYHIVEGIDSEYIYLKGTISFDYIEHDEVIEVEVTEYLLSKAGFNKCKNNKGSYVLDQFTFHTQRPNNPDKFLLVTEIYFCNRQVLIIGGMKYMHRLQNLFFALTGEELTINNQP